jgi:dihydropyrimidinase
MYDLAIINGQVYINQEFHQTNVYIKDGIISAISKELFESKESYDVNGDLVLPGIIDPHTHFALDLGHISSRDDFYYGTKAAAFGGVTTIIDFLEPVDHKEALIKAFEKRKEEAKESMIDYKFHACFKNPKEHVEELVQECKNLGLNTIKIFTTYSDSNRRTYETEIRKLLTLSAIENIMITAHIENDQMIDLNPQYQYRDLPVSRPTIAETSEALKLAKIVKETNGRLYMVHCSSGETLNQLKKQYPSIINHQMKIESCPHYFLWNHDVLQNKTGNLYTMAPPLRSEQERKLLCELIDSIDTIGTDHCAFHKEDKAHNLLNEMPLGIGGVEQSFDIMYSLFGAKIIDKMTINVAKAHRLFPQKGIIQVGSDADIMIYHIENRKLINHHGLANYNLYQELEVKGVVRSTISRGSFVVKNQNLLHHRGQLLNQRSR